MFIVMCDIPWQNNHGNPVCEGNLSFVTHDSENPTGLTSEDFADLRGHALDLFVIVFAALAIKKALSI